MQTSDVHAPQQAKETIEDVVEEYIRLFKPKDEIEAQFIKILIDTANEFKDTDPDQYELAVTLTRETINEMKRTGTTSAGAILAGSSIPRF
jgi:hypothetical protein